MSPQASSPDGEITRDLPVLAGRYQLLDQLGAGGMGAVFRARDTTLNRFVAIKILPAGKLQDADAVARFRREAMALAKLSHPNIIQAHDSGQDGDQHFLIMELVEGRSLSQELADKGRLSPTRAADYVRQAALALHHAHKLGLVHRDVKPSNLLLDAEGRVKLLDLGLARFLQDQIGDGTLTREGAGMGTPDYCSPEQFRDAHKADARSDIYSLGCTLYHLIAGRPPFPGSSLSEKAKAHQSQEPSLDEISADLPGGLALARMLAKRPADRFASMAEVAEALTPYVAHSSASFRNLRTTATWNRGQLETMTTYPWRRAVAPWLVAAAAMLLAVAALSGLSYLLMHGGGSPVTLPIKTPHSPTTKATKQPPKAEGPTDPNLLTVSQTPGQAKYRTIREALEAVKPGQTIRVLDDKRYRERLLIQGKTQYAGITLEAIRGAILEHDGQGNLVEITDAPDVSIRGFRLQQARGEIACFVAVRGHCPGLVLEDLAMKGLSGVYRSGIEFLPDTEIGRQDAPLLVENCLFDGLSIGIFLHGVDDAYQKALPVGRVIVKNNQFRKCSMSLSAVGGVRQLQVVGNRFWIFDRCGIQLEKLLAETQDILIANNTFLDGRMALRLWTNEVLGKNIHVCNNLLLGDKPPDMFIFDAIQAQTARGPGDGQAVARVWSFAGNWREGRAPGENDPMKQGWIPPSARDQLRAQIEGVNRDPQSPDFLRPAQDSLLAKAEGAGKEDPSLPLYIGAVPPKGATPWDWDHTWRTRMKPAQK